MDSFLNYTQSSTDILGNFKDLETQLKSKTEHDLFLYLKSIPEKMSDIDDFSVDYHLEPIYYEYFLGKERKFTYISRYLYIKLYEPTMNTELQKEVMQKFYEKDLPITLNKVMSFFPKYLMKVLDLIGNSIRFHDKLAQYFDLGIKKNPIFIRDALYLLEVLFKKEPTNVSLFLLGEYMHYNINWCIRFLKKHQIEYCLEDFTVLYLIKVYKQHFRNLDKRSEILSKLYIENC